MKILATFVENERRFCKLCNGQLPIYFVLTNSVCISIFSEEGQPGNRLSQGDLHQAEGSQEEVEGVFCWGARTGYGWSDQGMVPASNQADI